MKKVIEQRRRLADIREKAQALNEADEFGDEEQRKFDALMEEADQVQAWLDRNDKLATMPTKPDPEENSVETRETATDERRAPAHNRTPRGDNEERAYAHFVRTGDVSRELRASNATDMNITTAADGGNLVPTGHYNQIIARRDEAMIASRLGVRMIPGTGTTVNVPTDNEADGEFVSTAESIEYDLDSPAVAQVAMTLVKYTKKIRITEELMQDNDSNLLAFLAEWVARGMAKTHNDLLITEVGTSGTSFKTTASATVLADGELEDVVYNNDLAEYLDDAGSVAWVMRRATFGSIVKLASANHRIYAETPQGSNTRESLIGYPLAFSQKVAAYGTTTNKFAYFGNWFFVGKRELPQFTVLRDPYSRASFGEIVLHYSFRTVYKVLQAEAIGYIKHA